MTIRLLALTAASLISITVVASAQDFAPMALNSLSRAPAGLSSAAVQDQHGQPVGRVSKVMTDPTGKPQALNVAAAGGTVTVPASAVSYDTAKNIVTADMAMAGSAPARQIAGR